MQVLSLALMKKIMLQLVRWCLNPEITVKFSRVMPFVLSIICPIPFLIFFKSKFALLIIVNAFIIFMFFLVLYGWAKLWNI